MIFSTFSKSVVVNDDRKRRSIQNSILLSSRQPRPLMDPLFCEPYQSGENRDIFQVLVRVCVTQVKLLTDVSQDFSNSFKGSVPEVTLFM